MGYASYAGSLKELWFLARDSFTVDADDNHQFSLPGEAMVDSFAFHIDCTTAAMVVGLFAALIVVFLYARRNRD